MENTPDNRKIVAEWAIDSLTGGEPERVADFLFKEMCARYKREPGLFDSLVKTMEDDEAHAKWKAEEDALWEGYVPKPDKANGEPWNDEDGSGEYEASDDE